VAGVGEDVELDLLIKLLEILGVSVVIIGFRDNRLEAGSISFAFSVRGCSRVIVCRGCHSYGGTGGLYWGFCVSWILGSNWLL
jgi:hypothetical protein